MGQGGAPRAAYPDVVLVKRPNIHTTGARQRHTLFELLRGHPECQGFSSIIGKLLMDFDLDWHRPFSGAPAPFFAWDIVFLIARIVFLIARTLVRQ